MFHHLPPDEQRAMLAEVRRVLSPGGSLHLVDPDGTDPGILGWFARHDHGEGHGHGHGHGHGSPHLVGADDVATMLRDAGFTDVDAVARRTRTFGRVVFHRAVCPSGIVSTMRCSSTSKCSRARRAPQIPGQVCTGSLASMPSR